MVDPQIDPRLEKNVKEHSEKVRREGMRAGSVAMLGAVLEMCNKRKTTVYDIKKFCQSFLDIQENNK